MAGGRCVAWSIGLRTPSCCGLFTHSPTPSSPLLMARRIQLWRIHLVVLFTRCTHKAKAIKGLLIEANPHWFAGVLSDWG